MWRWSGQTFSRPGEIVSATEAGFFVLYEPSGLQYLGNEIEPSHIILTLASALPESATRVETIVNHDILSPLPRNGTFLARLEPGAQRKVSPTNRLQPSTAVRDFNAEFLSSSKGDRKCSSEIQFQYLITP